MQRSKEVNYVSLESSSGNKEDAHNKSRERKISSNPKKANKEEENEKYHADCKIAIDILLAFFMFGKKIHYHAYEKARSMKLQNIKVNIDNNKDGHYFEFNQSSFRRYVSFFDTYRL